jgi:hypothetical protein
MAALAPLPLPDVESSVLSLGHIIEETEVLSSEWRWTSDSVEAVRGCRFADTPQHNRPEPIVSSPAITILPHENVGFRFFCEYPRPFATKAGNNLADRRLALLNRFPDL